jgi:hypothetical protein
MNNPLKKEYITLIANKAINKLNKFKGTTLSLDRILIKQYKGEPMVQVEVINTKTKRSEAFVIPDSFFDASKTDRHDAAAGVDKISDELTKLVLRLAYRI